MAKRQCGSRQNGGFYLEVPTSPSGQPIEHFIRCLPVPVDLKEMGLSEIGVKILEYPSPCPECAGKGQLTRAEGIFDEIARSLAGMLSGEGTCPACGGLGVRGIHHVFDVIGANYYPNIWDFLREGEMLGFSRRLSGSMLDDAGKLERHSKLICIHKTALMDNAADLVKRMDIVEMGFFRCPKGHPNHNVAANGMLQPFPVGTVDNDSHAALMCSGIWRHMIIDGTRPEDEMSAIALALEPTAEGERLQSRARMDNERIKEWLTMPGFVIRGLECGGAYAGFSLPEGFKPALQYGIFCALPLGGIALVDPNRQHTDKAEQMRNKVKNLPTRLADE